MQRHWVFLLSVVCFVGGLWSAPLVHRAATRGAGTEVAPGPWGPAFTAPNPASATSPPGTLGELYRRLLPAVVNISTVQVVERGGPRTVFDPRFGLFRVDMPDETRQSLGSGVVLTADGRILTNTHVVSGADQITVQLAGGQELPASLVGADKDTDLALLRVRPTTPLSPAALGDSQAVRVGDQVFAIGNPLGLGHSLTTGIISYKGRALSHEDGALDFLQTDTAINPGNSGGPLFDMDGRVVGVNTLIRKDSEGIGFSIPVEIVKVVVPVLEERHSFPRGYLGVVFGDTLPRGVERGVLVTQVSPDSPAAEVGLQAGDVVLSLAGQPVSGAWQAARALRLMTVGTEAEMEFERGGVRHTVAPVLGDRDEFLSRPAASRTLGVVLERLDPRLLAQAGLRGGLRVRDVRPGSRATRVLRPGDVVLRIDGETPGLPRDAADALEQGGPRRLRILRDGRQFDVLL